VLGNNRKEESSRKTKLGLNFYPIRNVLPTEIIMSKPMQRTVLALLLTPLFSSCETAHDAAVSTFRVIDAPAAYIRRQIDEEGQVTQTTTTTTETQVYPDAANNPPSASYPVQPPPPPTQAQRRVVANEPSPPAEGEANPTATPRVVRSENKPPTTSSTARTTSSQSASADIPYGKPVPGKPGYVFSPFDKNGGYVDVTGYTPGQKVKDPYTGKIFLVP